MLTRKEIQRRKWIMRRNGINVVNDSSWGPRLNAMWLRLPVSVRDVESFWQPVREEQHDSRVAAGVHVVRDVVDGQPTGDWHYENEQGLIIDPDDVVDTKRGFNWHVKFKEDDPSVIDTLGTIDSNRYYPGYVSKPDGQDGVIHVVSNGKTNGATPSNAMLDAIIFSTARSGTDLKTNLGLSAQESKIWVNPNYHNGIYQFLLARKIGEEDAGQATFDHDIVNNHAYNHNIDQIGNWQTAYLNKYGMSPRYISAMRYLYDHPDQLGQYDETYDIHDVLSDGFLRYREKPTRWNPGQPRQIQYVTARANELWNSPTIQEYLNSDHAKAVWQAGLDSREEYPVETFTQNHSK